MSVPSAKTLIDLFRAQPDAFKRTQAPLISHFFKSSSVLTGLEFKTFDTKANANDVRTQHAADAAKLLTTDWKRLYGRFIKFEATIGEDQPSVSFAAHFARRRVVDCRNHYTPGMILVCKMVATMTRVEFYEVVKITTKTITCRKIGQRDDTPTGYLQGTVMPDQSYKVLERVPHTLHDKQEVVFSRRPALSWGAPIIRGHTYGFAHIWDGTPQAYNHCD